MKSALQNETREKPHILIISEKWCDGCEATGPSPSEHSFWGPLSHSGVATHSLFHFDEYYARNGKSGDEELLLRCKEEKPDLVFLIWLYSERTHVNPSIHTLFHIRHVLKIPIISWWGDTHAEFLLSLAEILSPYFDCSLSGDSSKIYIKNAKRPDRFYPLPHPKDPRIFFDSKVERDIDLSFIGTLRGDRKERVDHLRSLGLNIFHAGGQRNGKLSTTEYRSLLQRSKMTIDFVQFNGKEAEKINGRIFEATLCGAMLFSPERSDTATWFTPMVEFVPFSDDNDLHVKAHYYLSHPQELAKIAQAGHDKTLACYSGETFWRTVLHLAQAGRYNDEEGCVAYAQYLVELGKLTQARELMREVPQSSSSYARATLLLGKISKALGDSVGAMFHFESALNFLPDNPGFVAECALAIYSLGDAGRAEKILRHELNRYPNDPKLYAALSCLPATDESRQELLQFCLTALQRPDADYNMQLLIFEILYRIGFENEAEQVIVSAENLVQSKESLHRHINRFYSQHGEKSKAAFHQWMALQPGKRREQAWQVLPDVITLEYQGNLEAARTLLSEYLPYIATDKNLLQRKFIELSTDM